MRFQHESNLPATSSQHAERRLEGPQSNLRNLLPSSRLSTDRNAAGGEEVNAVSSAALYCPQQDRAAPPSGHCCLFRCPQLSPTGPRSAPAWSLSVSFSFAWAALCFFEPFPLRQCVEMEATPSESHSMD